VIPKGAQKKDWRRSAKIFDLLGGRGKIGEVSAEIVAWGAEKKKGN